MIIILEGLEGVGKTALANALSESTGHPIYRAFRSNPSERFGEGNRLEATLRSYGVPVNSYIEDLFVADLLTTIGGDVILDRSMPTGIAYGLKNGLFDYKKAWDVYAYWLWRMGARSDVLYVHMEADAQARSERIAPGRINYGESERAVLEANLSICFQKADGIFKTLLVDTTEQSKAETKAQVFQKIREITSGKF